MKSVKAKWDGERMLELTERYRSALSELVEAEIEMMRQAPSQDKDCWTWGEAIVEDMANSHSIRFCFGGDEEKPKGMTGVSRVVVE